MMDAKQVIIVLLIILIIWRLIRTPERFSNRTNEIHEYLTKAGRPTYTDYHKSIGGDVVEYDSVIGVPNTKQAIERSLYN